MRNSEGILSESDLRVLAETIAKDPYCGATSTEIQYLRYLPLHQFEENAVQWNVWYLAIPDLPHIEVIALTTCTDVVGDSTDTLKATWKVLRIAALLRAAYKAYQAIRDHWPDLSHFG